jgi:hypothetical protein
MKLYNKGTVSNGTRTVGLPPSLLWKNNTPKYCMKNIDIIINLAAETGSMNLIRKLPMTSMPMFGSIPHFDR